MSLKKFVNKVKNTVSDFSNSTFGRVANVALNPLSLNGGALSKLFGSSFSEGLSNWNLGTALGAGFLGVAPGVSGAIGGAIGGLGSWISANPILSGAIGLGGLNLATSIYSANQQAALQKEQNALNLQMMMMQNEYNSPLSQMNRYRLAGLNPNLLYNQIGSGNQSAPVEMGAVSSSANRARSFARFTENFSKDVMKAQVSQAQLDNAQRALQLQSTSIDNQYKLGLLNNQLAQKRLSSENYWRRKHFDFEKSRWKTEFVQRRNDYLNSLETNQANINKNLGVKIGLGIANIGSHLLGLGLSNKHFNDAMFMRYEHGY